MIALAEKRHVASARAVVSSKLEYLLPAQAISTTDYATRKRYFRGPTGEKVKWTLARTPYIRGIQDALDLPLVRVVGVQSAARWGKTVAAENKCMKHWDYGPRYNVLWYMQTADDLADYVDERFEWMLLNHKEVADKISTTDSRNSRFRKMIGDALLLMRAATPKTTRGKAAPIIVVDEIDAYDRRVRNAMRTLIDNRQREFGANAIAYMASHPDAGALGIAGIIADGLVHRWYHRCPKCQKASSFCQGAEERMQWNLPDLMKKAEDMERDVFLAMVQRDVRLICPHCRVAIPESQRVAMSNAGDWLQPHQRMKSDGSIEGIPREDEIMGFIGHGLMSPFVNMGKLARAWAAAKIKFDLTGDDTGLKEETVKSLGEVYEGGNDEERIENWKVVQARLQSGYALRTIPDGVVFLTAFVDVQGDRFEVRVIGWDLSMQSWLIDVFPVKQWPGFDTIDPTNRIRDWDIIEQAVLDQVYPIARTMVAAPSGELAVGPGTLFLPIAKTMVNAAGAAGEITSVTHNARRWLANLVDPQRFERMRLEADPSRPPRIPVESWKVQLFVGSRSATSPLYGKPYQVMIDDQNKPLAVPVWERAINVHTIKRLIARRMKIETPGSPGRMFLPFRLSPRYAKELTAEQYVNGEWQAQGANETWDGWVAGEAARALLQPERPGLWVKPPEWATPRPREAFERKVDAKASSGYYDRLAQLNSG